MKLTERKLNQSLKAFGMTNLLVQSDLKSIQKKYNIDLGLPDKSPVRDDFYPQFDESIRIEAEEMSNYYKVFFCLENTIRKLISDLLLSDKGEDWWEKTVPENVRTEVKSRINKDQDAGVTLRSLEPLDFTTFGELSEIISKNWSIFDPIFSNKKAVQKLMTTLNTLRGPIAHCSPLAEDEVVRLKLALRDWYRIMG